MLFKVLVSIRLIFLGYNPSHSVANLKWSEQLLPHSIHLTLLLKEKIKVTNLVIHCVVASGSDYCIPDVEVRGVSVLLENILNISDTSHGLFTLYNNNNNNNNKLEITFNIEAPVPFILTEIEIFGEDNESPFGTETNSSELLPIYLSTFFFAITLALIIPLLISVVVVCFKIKKQTLYFPVQQNSYNCQQKHFAPKQQQQQQQRPQQQQQQQQHSHYLPPQIFYHEPQSFTSLSIDPNMNYTPIGDESIKRIDTNTLNNMYERIPTIPTAQGNVLRDSIKRGKGLEGSGNFLAPSPRPKLPEIPIYSVPIKKNRVTVNRPSSHEGYLELRDMSVEDNSPAFGEDENPLYDYVRPRSAMINTESNQSLCTPTLEYVNVEHPIPREYTNNNCYHQQHTNSKNL